MVLRRGEVWLSARKITRPVTGTKRLLDVVMVIGSGGRSTPAKHSVEFKPDRTQPRARYPETAWDSMGYGVGLLLNDTSDKA